MPRARKEPTSSRPPKTRSREVLQALIEHSIKTDTYVQMTRDEILMMVPKEAQRSAAQLFEVMLENGQAFSVGDDEV